MTILTDYYEELHLDKELGLDAVNEELSRLESTWKRREINNPEKATKMLALIIDAREVFKDSTSRLEYDKALANSKKVTEKDTPEAGRRQAMEKWYSSAFEYYGSGQYDLAKTAIDNALMYADADSSDDDKLFSLAADIYEGNNEHDSALGFINRAIVASPDNPVHYITKARVFYKERWEI